MEIEYSQNSKFKKYAFVFDGVEIYYITNGLKSEIKKLQRELDKIKSNVKNEGQATWMEKERNIQLTIKSLNETHEGLM